MTTAIAKRSPAEELAQAIGAYKPRIAPLVPVIGSADRLVAIAAEQVRANPALANCTRESFLGCLFKTAMLGLDLGPQAHAHIIPYNTKNGMTATLQIGYRGMIELATRTGRVLWVRPSIVYRDDAFEVYEGTEPRLVHRPNLDSPNRKDSDVLYAYAAAKLANGEVLFAVLTKDEVLKRKSRSRAAQHGKDTPWDTDFAAMAMKSAVRALWRVLPTTGEMGEIHKMLVKEDQGAPVRFQAAPADGPEDAPLVVESNEDSGEGDDGSPPPAASVKERLAQKAAPEPPADPSGAAEDRPPDLDPWQVELLEIIEACSQIGCPATVATQRILGCCNLVNLRDVTHIYRKEVTRIAEAIKREAKEGRDFPMPMKPMDSDRWDLWNAIIAAVKQQQGVKGRGVPQEVKDEVYRLSREHLGREWLELSKDEAKQLLAHVRPQAGLPLA